MSDIITTYKLDDLDQPMPMNREEFYQEQIEVYKETGKPTRATAIVQILLFTPGKEIIVQKRSNTKKHNPGLMDKSIGGHILFSDSANYTAMVETLQELTVPSIVLPNEENFKKTFKLLKNFLNNLTIVQFIDSHTNNFIKVFEEGSAKIASKYYFYLGIYGGAIKPSDKEAAGVLFYKYDNLKKELNSDKTRGLYTDDLHFFINKYDGRIQEFLRILE